MVEQVAHGWPVIVGGGQGRLRMVVKEVGLFSLGKLALSITHLLYSRPCSSLKGSLAEVHDLVDPGRTLEPSQQQLRTLALLFHQSQPLNGVVTRVKRL